MEPDLEDPAKAREREKPGEPQTRDAALVAAAHGNPDGAARFLVAHLAGKWDDAEAVFALARAQRLIGQLDAAEQTLTKLEAASKDTPTKAEASRQLAHLRLARGDTGKAETHLRAAIKLEPDNLLLQGELVRLLYLTGRGGDSEARELIDQLYAAYSDGTAQTAEQLLGTSYAGLAERAFKSTSRVLQEAEQAAPPSSGKAIADEISMQLTELFLEKYQPSGAAETLALVLERDPWNPEALANMGWVHLDQIRPRGRVAHRRGGAAGQPRERRRPRGAWPGSRSSRVAATRPGRGSSTTSINVNPSHHQGQAVLGGAGDLRPATSRPTPRPATPRWPSTPATGCFFSHLSDLLGFLHLYPEADLVLVEGAKLLPDDPYVQGALGLSTAAARRRGQRPRGAREGLEEGQVQRAHPQHSPALRRPDRAALRRA